MENKDKGFPWGRQQGDSSVVLAFSSAALPFVQWKCNSLLPVRRHLSSFPATLENLCWPPDRYVRRVTSTSVQLEFHKFPVLYQSSNTLLPWLLRRQLAARSLSSCLLITFIHHEGRKEEKTRTHTRTHAHPTHYSQHET